MTDESQEMNRSMVEGILETLTDRHSQLDIQLKGLTLSLPGTHLSVQLSGTVSVAVHMRDLTDEEKEAHATANIAHIRA